MKYVVLTDGMNEFMFTMPRNHLLTHQNFAQAVQSMWIGHRSNAARKFRMHDVISGGFVDSKGKTFGESESLGVKSRPEDHFLLILIAASISVLNHYKKQGEKL
jgi:hypothetical protein